MAILTDGDDKYEVKIKKFPENTYFDEHVKAGEREKPDARSCDRYIVVEDEVKYTIELTLHKGFNFGKYEIVDLKLWYPGEVEHVASISLQKPHGATSVITEDMKATLKFAVIQKNGYMMKESRFIFRSVHLGKFAACWRYFY